MHRGGMAKWANKGWLVLGTSGGQCWAEGQGRGGVGAHGDGEQQDVLEDRCSRLQWDWRERHLRARKKKTTTKKTSREGAIRRGEGVHIYISYKDDPHSRSLIVISLKPH